MQVGERKKIANSPTSVPEKKVRFEQAEDNPQQPKLIEYDQLNRRANCLSVGALACGAMTGLGALIAMPVAYWVVSSTTARVLLYTLPVLVPAACCGFLASKAMQETRAAQALKNATQPDVVVV